MAIGQSPIKLEENATAGVAIHAELLRDRFGKKRDDSLATRIVQIRKTPAAIVGRDRAQGFEPVAMQWRTGQP
jgi:hypothetical protein